MTIIRKFVKWMIPSSLRPKAIVERLLRKASVGMRVLGGPFAGMRYTNDGYGVLLPKLCGTYECELWDVLRAAMKNPYVRLIDVGAGEGYYAVGFALRYQASEVIAYDAYDNARIMLAGMAEANGVSHRIQIKGLCDPENLESDLRTGHCFLIMDVEGAEDLLLDPVKVPSLKTTSILFESHDIIDPGVGGRVVRRFLDTHEILEIGARYRQPMDITFLPQWYVRYIRYELFRYLYERPDKPERMRWFYMVPKQ